jgi:bifunctional UDP-N-acetylglucosamine pyrophosphorylase/glucosamine-1-phosphate N-acetyltransferase
MARQRLQAIVLAAGKSSRFNTTKTKLTFTLCGQEMILYPMKLFLKLSINPLIVVGHQKETIISLLETKRLTFTSIEQHEQKGTGHALLCTQALWDADHVLVMNGDMPLVSEAIIQSLIDRHSETNASLSLVIAHNSDPSVTGYGRIVTDNNRISIVEAGDFVGDPSKY